MPLDVTHEALTTKGRIDAFRQMGTQVGDAVAGWLDFFEQFDVDKCASEGGPLHDPCVVAWLQWPKLFSGRHVNVEVETGSELTRGMTVADWWGVTRRPPNASFVGDVDAEGYFALLADRIGRLWGGRSARHLLLRPGMAGRPPALLRFRAPAPT